MISALPPLDNLVKIGEKLSSDRCEYNEGLQEGEDTPRKEKKHEHRN